MCASKRSLIFVLVIPPPHLRLSVICGSNPAWLLAITAAGGPGQAPGGMSAGAGRAQRSEGMERGRKDGAWKDGAWELSEPLRLCR